MKKLIISLGVFIVIIFGNNLFGQDFVYTPKNPAFGGSYINYSWLLSSATAQNDIEAPKKESLRSETDPLEDFNANLNRQILNQLSYQLVRDQFGENGMTEGTYFMGDYEIDVTDGSEGVTVNIYDSSTGSQTEVIVPHY